MKSILLMLMLMLVGCSGQPSIERTKERVVYKMVPISLPQKPNFPIIQGKDLRCLSPTVQWELLNRDKIMKDYISALETTITATH